MTPPGLTCPRCERVPAPLARRSDDGWVCTRHFCADCNTILGKKATSGLCRHCYDVRRVRARPSYGRGRAEAVHDARPCNRCGLPTKARIRICKDCRDVLGEELERWVAA